MANDPSSPATPSATPSAGASGPARFVRNLATISKLNKWLLSVFITLAIVGGVMYGVSYMQADTVVVASERQPTAPLRPAPQIEGAPGFTDSTTAGGGARSDIESTEPVPTQTSAAPGRPGSRPSNSTPVSSSSPTTFTCSDIDSTEPLPTQTSPETRRDLDWTGKLGGWMAKLGISFAAGILIGVFFRIYLKTMAVLAAVATAGIVALSYFEVINLDFTLMKDNYESASGWIGEQAERVKDFAMDLAPSLVAVTVGFFVGVMKK